MSTYTTHSSNGLPGRPARGALDKETIARARATPWEPGASSGAPRVLVGLAGAALIGGIALAIVLLSPSRVAKPVHADPAAVSQTAPAATSTSNADTPTPSPTANPAAWPQQEAPDLRSTRDRHPAPGQTNPANGE